MVSLLFTISETTYRVRVNGTSKNEIIKFLRSRNNSPNCCMGIDRQEGNYQPYVDKQESTSLSYQLRNKEEEGEVEEKRKEKCKIVRGM